MSALIILLACLMLVASLSLALWTRNRFLMLEQQLQERFPRQFNDELTALNAGTIGLGGRFLKVEKDVQSLMNQLDELRARMQQNSPYAQAILMAQKGSPAREIVDICGISDNEAQLIVVMHGPRKAA
jgi:hypothetical protein